MTKKVIEIAVVILLLTYFITLLLHISAHHDQYLWDFRTHRQAGKVMASGLNPYDADILAPKSGTTFLYTYPPVTLFFYRLFSIPDYKTAFRIFLISKFILLIGLVYFWQKEFLKKAGGPLFYVFCLLAFNSSVFLDMIAGNINLVQQALLWIGFWFYIKGRYKLFCLFTLFAASFKMTPIFFLILMLLPDDKNRYKYFFGAGAIFLAYLLIQYAIVPDLFAEFIKNALVVVGEPGGVVPSTNKLIAAIFETISKMTGWAPPRALQSAIFIVIAAAVVLFSYKACIRLKRDKDKIDQRALLEVFMVCLVYALIHPRFKDYGYILLLVPSYYIIVNIRHTRVAPFLFLLFILSSQMMLPIVSGIYELIGAFYSRLVAYGMRLPIASGIHDLIWAFYPLLVVYGVWGLYLHEIFLRKKRGG